MLENIFTVVKVAFMTPLPYAGLITAIVIAIMENNGRVRKNRRSNGR